MTNSRWRFDARPETAESAPSKSGQVHRSMVGSGCVVVPSEFLPPRDQASPFLAAQDNNQPGAFDASRMEVVA